MCVRVCVCVCEWERESVRACVCRGRGHFYTFNQAQSLFWSPPWRFRLLGLQCMWSRPAWQAALFMRESLLCIGSIHFAAGIITRSVFCVSVNRLPLFYFFSGHFNAQLFLLHYEKAWSNYNISILIKFHRWLLECLMKEPASFLIATMRCTGRKWKFYMQPLVHARTWVRPKYGRYIVSDETKIVRQNDASCHHLCFASNIITQIAGPTSAKLDRSYFLKFSLEYPEGFISMIYEKG